MTFRIFITLVCLLGTLASHAEAPTTVVLNTSRGEITVELFDADAPRSVANFRQYAAAEFYNGTIFHRVIADFMIQGGGFDEAMTRLPTGSPVPNEANNGRTNDRGTLAMARTQDPHSATAQFFINLKDNEFLNHRSEDDRGWGYTVFGRVIAGMDVVDDIATAETGTKAGMKDVPREPIIIISVRESTASADE
jgi:peptidyl-prolyl cis-trans isomerase B (cyclophilin B)